jgi:two-component system response regulator RegA
VLLVDDFDTQLRVWGRELAQHRVLNAKTREDAVKIARIEHADLAIVDLFLGAENGLDVVRDLRALDPELYIVLVSADLSVAYAMAAVRAGADDVLVKPLRCMHVLKSVEDGVPLEPDWKNPGQLTLDEVEWEHISRALVESKQNITQAAQRLGIYRQTLQRKLRKRGHDID